MKMKKKVFLILISIFIILGFTNVYAEDFNKQSGQIMPRINDSWPKSYDYKGTYEYLIEDVELYVYELNSENVSVKGNDIISTIANSSNMKKYLKDEPTRIINLSPADYTINPEYKEDKIYDYPTTFVNLNLNITKDKLQTLLSDEYSKVSKERSYIAEIIVKYKLNKAPSKYKYYMNVNTTKRLFNIFYPELNIENKVSALNVTNAQVFNIAHLGLNANGQKYINYESTLNDVNINGIFGLNYLALSEKANLQANENDDTLNLIMFHNYTNIDYLIKNSLKIQNNTEDKIKNIATQQVVKVEDTSSNTSYLLYVVSIIVIFAGVSIIYFVVNKNNN